MKLIKYLEFVTSADLKTCERYLKEKRIKVNGIITVKPNTVVKELKDQVMLDNEVLEYEEYIYLMMNKRSGYVSATEDNFQVTVFEDIKEFKKRPLRIVGRLDKDTEGLLLITDDGDFIHHLTSPKHNVNKTYFVGFEGVYPENVEELFKEGITLDDGYKCLPASIKRIKNSKCEITIQEGKFHQIKRMCAACGMKVTYLKRLSIGDVKLDESLNSGEYRRLTKEELESLKK
ncbi:MAG: pseudouridine synthase [Bacilli bacterium]|nr:pseudouridine synthase [Bacilli bacterium]